MKKKNNKVKQFIAEWWLPFVIALVFVGVLFLVVFYNAAVISGSMEGLLYKNDRVLGFRLAYLFSDPQRGDVVIFKNPVEEDGDDYIKRIIGLPGDTVTIRDNQVYINGSEEPLYEPYIKEPMKWFDVEYVVPEGCYFMLGDNRNHSSDSRYWNDPFVKREDLRARAFIKYFLGIEFIGRVDYD